MDIFNRAYSQLYDLFRSMTPGTRLTAGLLLAVVMLSAGYLFTHQTTSPEADLMHGVPVAVGQLPIMEAAFAKANLKGYEVRGASIYVPRGQEQIYMAALADAQALPPNIGEALSQAINSGTPFESSTKSADRMRIAKQIELSRIIRSMPGIENAYVLYDVDAKVGSWNHEKLITATVCVKPTGADQLEESRVSAIRHLVAGAIAGMKPENVTVSDLNGRTRYGNSEEAGSGENRYVSLKRTYEQDLKAKILNALSFIPSVTVELSVALDRESIPPVKPNKRITRKKQRANADSVEKQTARTDAPVQQPNAPSILNSLLNGESKEKEEDSETVEESDHAPIGQPEPADAGLKPVLATVSVGVPMSYFKKVWQERNPAEPGQALRTPNRAALDQIRGEETAMIQKHVAQLLPSPKGLAKAADLVTVTPFQDIPLQEPSTPNIGKEVLDWIRQSWGLLAVVGLGLASLLTLRSMVHRSPTTTAAPKATPRGDEDAADKPSPIPAPHARRFHNNASTYRDELSELVEDDPDTAANVLRSWIGHTN